MRKFLIFLTGVVFVLGLAQVASADLINTTGPTGEYYQYASFSSGSGQTFKGGGDVDSYGDFIYVNRDGRWLDKYVVKLLDTDGDGAYEPDQHPDNPDATGPMEQRILTFIASYDVPLMAYPTTGCLYAASDSVYFLGADNYLDEGDIYQYAFGTGHTTKVVDSPQKNMSLLGYDDVNNKWYGAAESSRTVYGWDGSSWVEEFSFDSLSGSHMDGLEVVTDPDTNIPYVYVSDMTSDYLGQWRYDATEGWVEENLFEYDGTAGYVEGLGYSALGHFWATTGFANSGTLYEIGGGELGGYIPPAGGSIPEPTTLAIWSVFGGLGLIAARRRRKVA